MTNDLESRLALLEKQLKEANQRTAKSQIAKTSQRRSLPLRKWRPGKRTIMLTAAVLVLGLGAGAFGVFRQSKNRQPVSPIPASILKTTSNPLYYPAVLPKGFTIDRESFQYTHDVLTYTVSYDNGKKLTFAVEPKPASFDFSGYYADAQQLKSSLGTAYVGAVKNNTVASITTDKTWILIGLPSPIDTSALEVILNHLTRASE